MPMIKEKGSWLCSNTVAHFGGDGEGGEGSGGDGGLGEGGEGSG